MQNEGPSRRHVFFGALLAGAVPAGGYGSAPSLKAAGYKSPNEKLNIAAIGAGGKGYSDIMNCAATENIVAMADPDDRRAERTYRQFPQVPKYKDFRRMFDREEKNIDAVLVSCPDHMHGTAAMWAIVRGKHVYCQKPLTRTVWEAQELLKAAQKYRVATQMGNQGYSNEGARQACEIVWAGDIGAVREVHAWTDRPGKYWPQDPSVEPREAPVPEWLDWDAWLGGSLPRPYSPAYCPHHWRGFPDFGCGAIGDMACHILGTPNMALRLSEAWPTSVECVLKEGVGKYTFPHRTIIRFEFPARGNMPPVTLYWYDGCKETPKIPGVPEGEWLGDLPYPAMARTQGAQGGPPRQGPPPQRTGYVGRVFDYEQYEAMRKEPDKVRMPPPDGSLFIGEKGMITTGTYGEQTRLVPAERMKDYRFPPPLLTRSPGHYRDWIRACKGGEPACSNFSVAAPFVSWMLLGVIAMRFEGKLLWDAQRMEFSNNREANQYLKPVFRKGWRFVG